MALFYYPPLLVALFLFAIDFGAIMLIRMFFEKPVYLGKSSSYIIGDSVLLPAYGYFAALVIQHSSLPALYKEPFYHISILALGFFVTVLLRYISLKNKVITSQQIGRPSEVYHSFIFAVMFYFVMSSLLMLIAIHPPLTPADLSMVAIILFLITCIIDTVYVSNVKKGTFWSRK